jgi:hypothetical protein
LSSTIKTSWWLFDGIGWIVFPLEESNRRLGLSEKKPPLRIRAAAHFSMSGGTHFL